MSRDIDCKWLEVKDDIYKAKEEKERLEIGWILLRQIPCGSPVPLSVENKSRISN